MLIVIDDDNNKNNNIDNRYSKIADCKLKYDNSSMSAEYYYY